MYKHNLAILITSIAGLAGSFVNAGTLADGRPRGHFKSQGLPVKYTYIADAAAGVCTPRGVTEITFSQTEFNTESRICPNLSPFKSAEDFRKHIKDQKTVITNVDQDHTLLLVNYFLDANAVTVAGGAVSFNYSTANFERAKDFTKALSREVIQKFTDDNACTALGAILPYMSNEQITALKSKCLAKALENSFRTRTSDNPMTRSISSEDLKSLFSSDFLKKFAGIDADSQKVFRDLLIYFPKDKAASIISSNNICRTITKENLKAYMESKEHASLIGPACFGKIAADVLIESDYYSKDHVQYLPNDIFKSITAPLANAFFEGMTLEQASKYHQDVKSARCKNLEPQLLSKPVFGRLPDDCILAWMLSTAQKGGTSGQFARLKNRWYYVRDGLMAKLRTSAYRAVLRYIQDKDWYYISTKNVQSLLNSPRSCQYIPAEAIREHRGLEIEPECFSYLPTSAQATYIAEARKLHDEIFSKVTSTMIGEWSYKGANDETTDRARLFKFVSRLGNAKKLIENLGVGLNNDRIHPCRAIDDWSYIEDSPALASYITADCFGLTGLKIDEEHLDKSNLPRFKELQPYETLQDKPDDFWNKITDEAFKQLSNSKTFCRKLQINIYRKINAESRGKISSECLNEIHFLSQLSKEEVSGLAPSAFASVESSRVPQIADKLTDEQFGNIDANVEDLSKNYGKDISQAQMGAFSTARLSLLNANLLAAIKAENFKSINNAERVGALKNVTKLTKDQVSNISPLEAFSAEQIANLGSTHVGKPEDPISLFTEAIVSKMSAEAAAAVKKRLGDAKAQTTENAASSNVTVALAAVLGASLMAYLAPIF